jgi:hypothetical protein
MSGDEKIEIPGTPLYLAPVRGHIHDHVGWMLHITEYRRAYYSTSHSIPPSTDAVRRVLTGDFLDAIQIAWERFGELIEHMWDAGLISENGIERIEWDVLVSLLHTICHEAEKKVEVKYA